MGFSIDKECVVKRSKAIKDDFVNCCPKNTLNYILVHMHYERVKKPGSSGFTEGCWLYDKSHKHKPHKADIMCCK